MAAFQRIGFPSLTSSHNEQWEKEILVDPMLERTELIDFKATTTMTGSLLTSRAGNVATSSSTSMQELIMKYECRIQELERENSILKQKQVEVQTAKELYLKIFEVFPALIWRSRLDKKCDY